MKTLDWKKLSEAERKSALLRPKIVEDLEIKARVSQILGEVQSRGDAALIELERRFDCPDLKTLEVSPEEWAASENIDQSLKKAVHHARENIERFHQAGKPSSYSVETQNGIVCQKVPRAIESVGLYIPGGSAPLISTALMLGVPSQIAGSKTRILCSPPSRTGDIAPAVLYAARICGIERAFKLGGAGAIGAMAYGTQSVPSVCKIFGPGNAYVTEAKQQVSLSGCAIDMPAGPSEVLVVADASARPGVIAADLLSQAEHGPDSDIVFVTDDEGLVEHTQRELIRQVELLPRKEIARQSVKNARLILAESIPEAIQIANAYAPEHLILQTVDAETLVDLVTNAGSVFVGHWTPESVGDYASGTNHVLPTYGYARAYSGLSVTDFMRSMSVQKLTEAALKDLGPSVTTLARAESLEAHARAVEIRTGANP